MFVKVLRPFTNDGSVNGIAKEGSVIEVSVQRGSELEKKGLVVPTVGGKSGASDPFPLRQRGGRIGEGKPAPSSPVVPPQPLLSKQVLPKRRGRKPRSSP